MSISLRALTTTVLLAAIAPASAADGLNPGSVLIYPIHRSGMQVAPPPGDATAIVQGPFFSVIAVTNTNLVPATPINGLGGSTNIHWEYVNTVFNQQLGSNFPDCVVQDRTEFLTPGDTRVVLTNCHNPSFGQEGYVVVSARDPNLFSTAWSHNFLVGSEFVLKANLLYHVNAIPFEAIDPAGTATDHDLDDQLDFDGVEYEPIPDHLFLDFFVDAFDSSIVLINMSGGFAFTAVVQFDIFNDNEQALSATLSFRCWIEKRLRQISLVFSQGFLAANTLHNPAEFDIDCDNIGDLETGWARIRGLTNSSSVESYSNPALLGAHTKDRNTAGGRRLWESTAKQTNGDFFKTGTNDVEFP